MYLKYTTKDAINRQFSIFLLRDQSNSPFWHPLCDILILNEEIKD